MCKGGIYCIVNTIDGKRYIGSTKCFRIRFSKHKSDLRKKKHHSLLLQRSWDKHGSNSFEFKILEEIEDCSLYKKREQYYLDNGPCEYNIEKIVNQGMLGKTHTEEAKALMSRVKKGTGCGFENPMFGKFKTLHHNFGKKMPQNGKSGENHPNYGKLSPNRKIVLQFSIDGVFIKEFLSIKDASIELDIHPKHLGACCNGKYKQAKGFIFKFKQG